MSKTCRSCRRGYIREDNGFAVCGAAVDDEALLNGETGKNAIWAERKYGRAAIMAALTTGEVSPGIDCENVHPDDGALCALWEAK